MSGTLYKISSTDLALSRVSEGCSASPSSSASSSSSSSANSSSLLDDSENLDQSGEQKSMSNKIMLKSDSVSRSKTTTTTTMMGSSSSSTISSSSSSSSFAGSSSSLRRKIVTTTTAAEAAAVDGDEEEEEDDDDDETGEGESNRKRSPSPTVPEGQYEVERVVDYVRDDTGEMYFVKWKNWEEEFNTWEPPQNLVNCDVALLDFYLKRKMEYDSLMSQSEYVITEGGKKRRKGPKIDIQVPPDPRPVDVQVGEFFQVHGELTESEIEACRKKSAGKKKSDNRLWTAKLSKELHAATDGKLTEDKLKVLRLQLVELEYNRKRKQHDQILREWELHINSVSSGKPKIKIENHVDWEGPPENFVYISDYVTSGGISIPDDPPVGCSCTNCFDNKNGCCAAAFGVKFAYNQSGRLRVPVGTPIYECNRKCNCDSSCPNRVVQDGQNSSQQFCIYRTSNGCGWGVKTLKSIKKGTFVTLYVGEVINTEEAERRGREYDAEGCTYLFDLDFNEQDQCPYTVDAAKYGNIAHFINHSCDPNLAVFAVWVDCLDVNLPKLALFAIYDIAKGEELTFDYKNLVEDRGKTGLNTSMDSEDGRPRFNKECFCGSKNCRKFLF